MNTLIKPVRSVREQIVDQLRHEVLADQLKAEQPLREADLAERFGVGRGPVRDALLQLTQEGALVYQPNRGVRVGVPAADEMRELLVNLRRQIETSALEQVFASLTDDDHRAWSESLENLKRACRKGAMSEIVEHDMAFHRSLVRRAGAGDLEAIWLPITMRIRLAYSRHDDLMEVHREHALIVDAIRQGKKKAALRALGQHIF